jgi:transposase
MGLICCLTDYDVKLYDKQPQTLQRRATELYQQGHSYRKIAITLSKSRTTVYYYLKKMRGSVK